MRSLAVTLVVLCAASVQAQPAYSDARGAYGVLGNAAPERLPLPWSADPDLVVGIRFSDRFDLHLGAESSRYDNDFLRFEGTELADVRRYDDREQTTARVVTLGYTERLRGPQLRGSASLGYESYRFTRRISRPDSVPYARPSREPGIELVPLSSEQWQGSFLSAGVSAVVAAPIGRSRFRITPGVGVAATVTTRLSGDVDAQYARVMPFVHVPVTGRFRGFTVTYETTLGVSRTAPNRRFELLTGETLERPLAPVVSGSLRINV